MALDWFVYSYLEFSIFYLSPRLELQILLDLTSRLMGFCGTQGIFLIWRLKFWQYLGRKMWMIYLLGSQ